MANPKSYAWSQHLNEAVPVGEDAQVSTPGIENPTDYKTDEAEVVHNGQQLRPEQFTVTWEEDWSHAHVTNGTETDWQPGDTVYVTIAGIPFDPADVEASFTDLDARVAAVETEVEDHETRITALETPAARETRGTDSPPAPKQHDENRDHAKDNHRKPDNNDKGKNKSDHKGSTKAKVTVTASKTFIKKPAKPFKKPAKPTKKWK